MKGWNIIFQGQKNAFCIEIHSIMPLKTLINILYESIDKEKITLII